MIDNHALARSRDPEILALADLMERVLRWVGRQEGGALQSFINEVEEELEDLEHRDVTQEHQRIAEAALKRQRELISIARAQYLEPRLPRA